MEQYGLIGYPLKHSFSKGYFNDKFDAEKIDAEYVNFEIPSIREFKTILKDHPNLKGLNVTIPYKEQVIPYLDQLSENAKLIGAVNVIKIEQTSKGKIKKLTGFNSDIIGFKKSIEPMLQPHHQKALVLGTGGAAKAIYYGLKQLGIVPVYVSREKQSNDMLTYDELTAHDLAIHTIIVNCTPVGMWPHVDECPKIPYKYLTSDHLLYDLLYNPNETLFMKTGAEQGATVVNGLEMLLLQAFASWEFWQN
ncbi:MAG: shikimate dehydrogenase [Dysgonamonadaceae bacterium]|jgi:shikimate dehydrogenase|nr:shikimate dehydrogenase [Dysgonamonadaceae bacterium]